MTDFDQRIADLRRQQESLIERSTAIVAAADAAGRPLDEDERRGIRQRSHRVEALQAEIDDLMAAGSVSQPRISPPNAAEPLNSGSTVRTSHAAAPTIAPIVNLAADPVRPSAAALFGAGSPASVTPAPSFGRWLHALAMRDTQFVLQAAGARSDVGAEGGFAVPAGFSTALLNSVIEQSFFLSRCRVVPMTAEAQTYPVLNAYDRTKGPAGFTAEHKGEGAQATTQTPAFGEVTLRALKTVTLWTCTQEMLQGAAPGTDRALIDAAAGAIAMQIDREIWAGTGVGMMLGVSGSPATVVQAKDGSQSANTVSYSNLVNMLSRLHPSSYRRSAWFASPSALPALLSVYNPVKNVAASENVGGIGPVLTQLADGSFALFGRPLVISDFCPALSSQGDVSLIDFSQYLVGLRENLRIEVSPDFLFDQDKVAFKVVQRRAGQPIPSAPFTPAVGSATLSPFVQLQAR